MESFRIFHSQEHPEWWNNSLYFASRNGRKLGTLQDLVFRDRPKDMGLFIFCWLFIRIGYKDVSISINLSLMALETRKWLPELIFNGRVVPEGLIFLFSELKRLHCRDVAVYTPEGDFEMEWRLYVSDNEDIFLETDQDSHELCNGYDMYNTHKDQPYCNNIFVLINGFILPRTIDVVKSNTWIALWDT